MNNNAKIGNDGHKTTGIAQNFSAKVYNANKQRHLAQQEAQKLIEEAFDKLSNEEMALVQLALINYKDFAQNTSKKEVMLIFNKILNLNNKF